MAKISKYMKKNYEAVDRNATYSVADAIKILKDCSKGRKFVEQLEISVNTSADPKHADQNVRGTIELPHGTGKTVRVAVMAADAKAEEAKKAGADIVGSDDLADKIRAGEMDFDRLIATPDMMPKIGQLGKILGPKGLMPNPKLGTVTMDVKKAVESAKAGSLEYRAEKAGIIHAGVGQVSFDDSKLVENVTTFLTTIQKARPSGVKGTFIKKVTLTSSMGPGIKIDLDSLAA